MPEGNSQTLRLYVFGPLGVKGLWLRYAALQNLIPSFPWSAPIALHPSAIHEKEGIKFCHLATLQLIAKLTIFVPPGLLRRPHLRAALRPWQVCAHQLDRHRRQRLVDHLRCLIITMKLSNLNKFYFSNMRDGFYSQDLLQVSQSRNRRPLHFSI